MKKLLVIIAGLLCPFLSLEAQRLWLMDADSSLTKAPVVFDLSGEAAWRSNAVDSEMLDHLVFGGHIERPLIERQSDRMSEYMRLGAGYRGQLRFLIMRDSVINLKDWGWQVQLENRNHLEVAAPRDLFDLTFKGNNPDFLGVEAELGETWIDRAVYQKFGFGMLHKPTLSGFVISAVNGQSFDRLYLLEGSLFTSESGDSLAVGMNGDWIRSDEEVRGFGAGNGIGVALDGVFNLPLKENKGVVSIGLRDFGFVQWNEATSHSQTDTLWTFDGVEVSDFINDGSDVLPQFNDSLFLTTETKRQNRWLPGYAYTRLMHKIHDRDFFEVTMVFRPVNAFVPLFSVGYHYRLPGRALLGATARYGGYGGLRAGISAEKWFGDRWFAALTTEDVYGLIAKKGLGMQAGFRLTYLLTKND